MKQEFSIPKLMNRCQSEADAYELLEELRWNGQPVCPHCGSIGQHYFLKPKDGSSVRKTRTGSLSQRRVWKCRDCRKQFSVLTGTIFHGSKISIRTWVLVVLEMCASKNGVAAREIERKYELTNKTAWFMLHRIREAMKGDPLGGLLRGTVVADETFIGGNPGNNIGKSRTGGKPSWARTDKTAVLALVDRESGEVRSRVVPDVTGPTLRKAIAEHVDMANTDLQTDAHQSYVSIASEFRSHKSVNHDRGEYVAKDGTSTNPAESYFSQLKRSIDGTHHHVSKEHLARYLAQFDFMRTWCETDDSDRMRGLLQQVAGRRLTYKPLTDS
ncbi:MAG: IS1595 family transposase [Actinomycetes bacterium]